MYVPFFIAFLSENRLYRLAEPPDPYSGPDELEFQKFINDILITPLLKNIIYMV